MGSRWHFRSCGLPVHVCVFRDSCSGIGRNERGSSTIDIVGQWLTVSSRVIFRRGSAARVPDGRSLEEHLLTVAEGLTALGAPSAGRMKVVVIACLEHLHKIKIS